jgi:outer membrane murein-binding lipoprotein Lpp
MADKKSREDELTEKVQELEGEVKTLEKERDGLRVKLTRAARCRRGRGGQEGVERADAAEARLDEMPQLVHQAGAGVRGAVRTSRSR